MLGSWAAHQQTGDHDIARTAEALCKIREAQRRRQNLLVVPAPDSQTQDALGYFPHWVR